MRNALSKNHSLAVVLSLATTFLGGCAADATSTEDDDLEEVTGVSEERLTEVCSFEADRRFFELPKKSDMVIEALPCIQQSDNGLFVRARIEIEWDTPLIARGDYTKTFHSFVVNGRLIDGKRVTRKLFTCNEASAITTHRGKTVCSSPWYQAKGTKWSSDGSIVYDVQGDDRDDLRWDLE